MSCANVLLTIAAAATFLFGAWPGIGGAAAPWVVGIASLLIIVVAWTGVTCKWCAAMEAKKPQVEAKAPVKAPAKKGAATK